MGFWRALRARVAPLGSIIGWAGIPLGVLALQVLALLADYGRVALPTSFAGFALGQGTSITILSTTAQILGFVITLLLTGVFMTAQYLGDRLPMRVLRPYMLGRAVIIPFAVLFLVLGYDALLLFLSGTALVPSVGTAVVVLMLVLSLPICLWFVIRALQALNVLKLTGNIGSRAKKFVKAADVDGLLKALTELRSIIEFAGQHDQQVTATRAFRTFLAIVLSWSDKMKGHLELTAGEAGKASFEKLEKTFADTHMALVSAAITHQNSVMFGMVVRELVGALHNLNSDFRDRYEAALTQLASSSQLVLGQDFLDKLLQAANVACSDGLSSLDCRLLGFGIEQLRRLWANASSTSTSLRAAILDSVAFVLISLDDRLRELPGSNETGSGGKTTPDDAKPVSGTRQKLVEYRNNLVAFLFACGFQVAGLGIQVLASDWLSASSAVISHYARKSSDCLPRLIEQSIPIYSTSLNSQCPAIRDNMPGLIAASLSHLPSDYPHYGALSTAILKYRPPIKHSGTLPLVGLFDWLYKTAISRKDHETATGVLKAISMFPLDLITTDSDVPAFLEKAAAQAVGTNDLPVVEILTPFILAILRDNAATADESSLLLVIRALDAVLEWDKLPEAVHLAFVAFCQTDSGKFDENLQGVLFAKLNGLVTRVRTAAILSAAQDVYGDVALSAVESGDQPLARLASNLMGWLAYNVITADLSFGKKARTLESVMDRAVSVSVLANKCELPRATRLFLSTLFVVLGAVCEELGTPEGPPLLAIVEDAIVSVGDIELFRDAVFARYHADLEVPQLRGKIPAAYNRLLAGVELRMSRHTAAATRSTRPGATGKGAH